MSQQIMPVVSIITPDTGVPGFTSMTDGYVIPIFLGEGTVSLGEFVFALTDTERKIMGDQSTSLGSAVTLSIQNADDDVDYVVPSGKTSRAVIQVDVGTPFTGSIVIRASDDVDTANGTVLQTWSAVAPNSNWNSRILTFATGKFITVTHETGSGSAQIKAWIAEEV